MSKIQSIRALEILDSRGNPTLQVTVKTENGFIGKAAVPSGASTGEHEAMELRDKDMSRYMGKGVTKAVHNVNEILAPLLMGKSVLDQKEIDNLMIQRDNTPNKSALGANAMLGVSLACAKAAAAAQSKPLYHSIADSTSTHLPVPMMNIINGGAHADNTLDFQEFMIRPVGAPSFKEAVRWGTEIFHTLKALLKTEGYNTSVGDEGGFAPALGSNEEALDFIIKAINKAGFTPGKDITISLDCAASEFYDKEKNLYIEKKMQAAGKEFKERKATDQITYLLKLCENYPIDSIEDPLDENDWEGWSELTTRMKNRCQIVGDDIFVTNQKFLKRGIEEGVANSILIKVNQIGTLTETLDTIAMAKKHGYTTVISHRSGETEDTTIADIAVATMAGQIKTGALSRTDRVAKYNRLLEIEDELAGRAVYQR